MGNTSSKEEALTRPIIKEVPVDIVRDATVSDVSKLHRFSVPSIVPGIIPAATITIPYDLTPEESTDRTKKLLFRKNMASLYIKDKPNYGDEFYNGCFHKIIKENINFRDISLGRKSFEMFLVYTDAMIYSFVHNKHDKPYQERNIRGVIEEATPQMRTQPEIWLRIGLASSEATYYIREYQLNNILAICKVLVAIDPEYLYRFSYSLCWDHDVWMIILTHHPK